MFGLANDDVLLLYVRLRGEAMCIVAINIQEIAADNILCEHCMLYLIC